jgi:hypothetical protein
MYLTMDDYSVHSAAGTVYWKQCLEGVRQMTKKKLADLELIFRSRGISLGPGMSAQQIE